MRIFRKVVLPIVWAVIFSTMAVSLAVMAFASDPEPPESGLKPTGEIPASNTGVGRATVENTLEIPGTVTVDAPVVAEASHDGVVNHFFVPVGAKVKAGDNLFQIKSEETDTSAEEGEDAPKPRTSYHNVVATKAGTVASFSKELDDPVAKGDAVASIRLATFRATGSISPIDQYRLLHMPGSATVTITGGPAPFKCGDLSIGGPASTDTSGEGNGGEDSPAGVIVGDPEATGQGEEGGGAVISCRVPDDVRVFDGLDMRMSIKAGRAEDVLVVPVTAVRGLIDSGTVWVITDDGPVERKVRLGLSDGKVVEVTKGLKDGENVLEFVPGSGNTDGEEDFGKGVG